MTRRREADNRIEARLAELRRQERKAFATYLVADYLDADGTLAHMRLLARNGVDVIEVGYPFSDPILDGAVIQAMNRKAVSAGGNLARTIELCAAFRADDGATPLILMGYANPIATMGYGAFARRAAAAGVDGVIIGDMPLREAGPLAAELSAMGLRFIPLAAPTLPAQEFVSDAPGVGGFLYCIPVIGPTGGPSASERETKQAVERCRAATSLPIIVGFGIKSPAAAVAAARYGDGVAVASALLERLDAIRQDRDVNRALEVLASEIVAYRRALDGE
jgi:tryptophan synthase alpha chain